MEKSVRESKANWSLGMKILMLIPYPNTKGPINKHTPHLIEGLRSLDCHVETECWGKHEDQERIMQKVFGRAGDIIRIKDRLKTFNYDIMVIKTAHDWNTLLRDVALLTIISKYCSKIVLQFHGSEPGKLHRKGNIVFRFSSKLLMELCNGAMVLSTEEQREWERFFPRRKFFVVSNPFVPESPGGNLSYQPMWNFPRDAKVLLFVGRLIREKGIFDLIEALTFVKSSVPVHLLVVGDGKETHLIKKRVSELRFENQVTLTGYLQGNALQKAYHYSDLLVLPTYSEGFPTVIAEAMNAGLPIVTTRIRGAIDHLQEGINTLFVPLRDPVALAEALTKLLNNPALCEEMAQANREKVKGFAPEIVARQYLDVLIKITGG